MDEVRNQILGYTRFAYPDLTDKQRGALVSGIYDHEEGPRLANYHNPASDTADAMIGFVAREVISKRPELTAPVPDRADLIAHICAQHAAEHDGESMDGEERMVLARRLANASPDELIAEAAKAKFSGRKTPEKKEAKATAAPVDYRTMSPGELDVEVERKWNVKASALPLRKLEEYRNALRGLNAEKPASNFEQALAAGVIKRPLTAQERIEAHRRRQVAQKTS